MAIVLVSGNLNAWGNSGQFESDDSTWLGAAPYYGNIIFGVMPALVRDSAYSTAGIYSAVFFAPGTVLPPDDPQTIIKAKPLTDFVISKKYVARVRVRTDVAHQVAPDAMKVVWDRSLFPAGTIFDSEVGAFISDMKTGFVMLELYFRNTSGQPTVALKFDLNGQSHYGDFALHWLWADQFEIYEYVDDSDPDPEPEPEPAPLGVYFHKNPVVFSKTAAPGWELVNNLRLYADVRIEKATGSAIFESSLKTRLYPDTAGTVNFYMRQAFREIMDPVNIIPPAINEGNIVRLTDRIKFFNYFSGQTQDDEVTPVALTESDKYLVLWGGINKLHYPGLNFFATYIPTFKKFMSWSPAQKLVDRQQEDYINFWIYTADITSLQLQIRAYFDDGTDQTSITRTVAGVLYGQLYQIPTGPQNSGAVLIDPTKNLVKYELSLLDGDGVVITEIKTFIVSRQRHPLTRFFMFLNSLGSFEVLRFTGASEETTKFTREVVQRFLPHNYSALDGELAINSSSMQDTTNYSTGFLKGRYAVQWQEYMKDFMLSPKIYEVTDGTRVRVVVTTDTLPGKVDQEYLRFARFDAQDAYINDSFTPKKI